MKARNVMVATGLLLLVAGTLEAGQRNRFSWSTREATYRVSYEGEIEFTDDDLDVKSISPGGSLELSDGGWFGGKGVDFRADASGAIRRRYRVSIIEKPYEPEGRAWLTRMLPAFIRESGIGARARVARILKSQGLSGVLAEVSRIQGSWGKRVYLTELLRSGPIDPPTVALVLRQAAREVRSDYEMAELLVYMARLPLDPASQHAFIDALYTIDSDYEHARAVTALCARPDLTDDFAAGMLESALKIGSDYEQAQFLVRLARQRPIDGRVRRPFFAAVDTVQSSYERGRVLQQVARHPRTPPDTIVSVLRAAEDMDSSYERSQVLLAVAAARERK